MTKFNVVVTERVVGTYSPITVEAGSEGEARELAEHDRVQGALGKPHETVQEVDFATNEIPGSRQAIIITGNPVSGFEFYGPFSSEAEAVEWGNGDPHLDESWCVAPLEPIAGG